MKLKFLWLILVLGGLAGSIRLAAQSDFPGADEKWRHYRSPNFELYSRNPEAMSRELLHDLERLREFFLGTFKLVERRRQEVTIYYFRSEKDFRAFAAATYGPKHRFVGFYVAGVDRAVISMVTGDDAAESRRTIYHEYIHHLLRTAEQSPPVWLNEGLAEIFSTVEAKDGKLEFGHPPAGRLWEAQNSRLMPLEALFAVDHNSSVFKQGGHAGLFYAQSWALVHYLFFGESKIPAEKRQRFLELTLTNKLKDAAQMRGAFQEVFGIDYPEMLKRLEAYLRNGKYASGKNPLPPIPAQNTYVGRAVPLAEIHPRLAELAFRMTRSPQAKLALLQAIERTPGDFRPYEALGADALRDGDENVAKTRWERAVEAGTQNPAIYRELGLMEGRAWFSQFNPHSRMPEEKAERLRRYLLRSIEYNPEQSDAYEMLAWVESFSPEPNLKNITLVQRRYAQLTRRERTAVALAFVRVRVGQSSDALAMLADLEQMEPDEWERYAIEAIRAYVEQRPINPRALPTAPSDQTRKNLVPRGKIAPPGTGIKTS